MVPITLVWGLVLQTPNQYLKSQWHAPSYYIYIYMGIPGIISGSFRAHVCKTPLEAPRLHISNVLGRWMQLILKRLSRWCKFWIFFGPWKREEKELKQVLPLVLLDSISTFDGTVGLPISPSFHHFTPFRDLNTDYIQTCMSTSHNFPSAVCDPSAVSENGERGNPQPCFFERMMIHQRWELTANLPYSYWFT